MTASPIVFPADTGNDLLTLLFGLTAALAGFGAALYLYRHRAAGIDYNRRLLVVMLLFFFGILGTGTALFSFLNWQRLQPVIISQTDLTTGFGTVALRDIKNATIVTDRQASLIDPNRAVREGRVMLIEERSGKVYALSEDNYDINRILATLRALKRSEE